MGRGTLVEVRDGSGALHEGLGRVGCPKRCLGLVEEPSERSGMGQGTLLEVRDGSGDPSGGPRWVVGPSQRSRTGRETLAEVRDMSNYPLGGPG